MQIYIGNLSAEITSFDLAPLFKGYDENPSFQFRYFLDGYKRNYYALTSDIPETMAVNVIARRHMTRIKDRAIMLHAYQERSIMNERRAFGWGSKQWGSDERRNVDRRGVQYDRKTNVRIDSMESIPDLANF